MVKFHVILVVVLLILLVAPGNGAKKKEKRLKKAKHLQMNQTTIEPNEPLMATEIPDVNSTPFAPLETTESVPVRPDSSVHRTHKHPHPSFRRQNQGPSIFQRIDSKYRLPSLDDPLTASDEDEDLDNSLDDLLGPSDPLQPPSDYEDFLFEDYTNLDTNEPTNPTGSKYLASEVCGRKFYCRRGERGPCQRNEVLTMQTNETTGSKRLGCTSLMTYPWNGCLPSSRIHSTSIQNAPVGVCNLRFSHRPCFGYPSSYRFHKPTNRCYQHSTWGRWATSGPCSPNKIFVDVDGINGNCRCRDRNHLLWKTDDRCYRAYVRGPCQRGEWLEPDSNGYSVCRPCPCPERADGRHIYWNVPASSKPGCYKSFTTGPCRHGYYFVIDDYIRKDARCVPRYAPASRRFYPPDMGRRFPPYSNDVDPFYSRRYDPWNTYNSAMYPQYPGYDNLYSDYDW